MRPVKDGLRVGSGSRNSLGDHLFNELVVGDLAINRSKRRVSVEGVVGGRAVSVRVKKKTISFSLEKKKKPVEITTGADSAACISQRQGIDLPLVVSLHSLKARNVLHRVLVTAENLGTSTHGPRISVTILKRKCEEQKQKTKQKKRKKTLWFEQKRNIQTNRILTIFSQARQTKNEKKKKTPLIWTTTLYSSKSYSFQSSATYKKNKKQKNKKQKNKKQNKKRKIDLNKNVIFKQIVF